MRETKYQRIPYDVSKAVFSKVETIMVFWVPANYFQFPSHVCYDRAIASMH